jgi:beta-xylosidase
MPEALARTHKRLFGYLVSEPVSLEKWSALVSALIRHLQERYGREALRNWRFSVWHQPDTTEAMYGFSTDAAFYAFYRETYLAVKRCDSSLSFGAPSTYYLLQEGHENWYLSFWRWCRENNCLPDFFNFHYYDLILDSNDSGQEAFGFTRSMTLRDSPDGFGRFITQVLSERKGLSAEDRPIYLSEWNNTPSQQDLLNDTCFKSCYIIKEILEDYDQLDSFGYWSLTDWMGEAPQPKELFFGGLGLFTANGIPKASYYAFTLLRQLGDTLLGRGDGWFITRQGDSYQILLYNYRHFSHLYALGERFDMTFTDRYTPFSPEQMLDVHLSVRDVEDGEYMVTETILNRSSGSAFDQWVAMGAVELTQKAELDTLAARSTPAINKYVVTSDNGTLRLDAMLDMLEVRLIEVKRLK